MVSFLSGPPVGLSRKPSLASPWPNKRRKKTDSRARADARADSLQGRLELMEGMRLRRDSRGGGGVQLLEAEVRLPFG